MGNEANYQGGVTELEVVFWYELSMILEHICCLIAMSTFSDLRIYIEVSNPLD